MTKKQQQLLPATLMLVLLLNVLQLSLPLLLVQAHTSNDLSKAQQQQENNYQLSQQQQQQQQHNHHQHNHQQHYPHLHHHHHHNQQQQQQRYHQGQAEQSLELHQTHHHHHHHQRVQQQRAAPGVSGSKLTPSSSVAATHKHHQRQHQHQPQPQPQSLRHQQQRQENGNNLPQINTKQIRAIQATAEPRPKTVQHYQQQHRDRQHNSHQQRHHQQQHNHHHRQQLTTAQPFGTQQRSVGRSGRRASIQHNSKAIRHNRLDADYADDYYSDYDDGIEEDVAADSTAEEEEDDDDEEDRHSLSDRQYARVTRDQLSRRENYGARNEDDYADDEPYRSPGEQYQADAPGDLTAQKFRELGSPDAVRQSQSKYQQEQELLRTKTPAQLALEHIRRINSASTCSRPLPRVIHVSNETSKRYVPHCTILHRCGEDTGCCESTKICAAKNSTMVKVYFFVHRMNAGAQNIRETEMLELRNDTECYCVERSARRDKRSGYGWRLLDGLEQGVSTALTISTATASANCSCPKHFDAFYRDALPQRPQAYGVNCRCDCRSSSAPCLGLQSGIEGFPMDDRKCIADRRCLAPTCLHGDYSVQTGRCPRTRQRRRPIATTLRHHDGYGYG